MKYVVHSVEIYRATHIFATYLKVLIENVIDDTSMMFAVEIDKDKTDIAVNRINNHIKTDAIKSQFNSLEEIKEWVRSIIDADSTSSH